jgi:hypothetical protein
LEPGDRLSLDDRPDVRSVNILPGLDQPFCVLIEATGGYEHCCCEQTAAKLLATVAMYVLAHDDIRRGRALEMIMAGVRRQRSMWLPGRGFKLYPDWRDCPEDYWGAVATRHLLSIRLAAELDDGGRHSEGFQEAISEAIALAREAAVVYQLPKPAKSVNSAADAYYAIRFGSDGAAEAVRWARDYVSGDAGHSAANRSPGAVEMRVADSYAAATLLRGRNSGDLREALRLANRVVQQIGPEGRLYSTVDSVAAIALLAELRSARILDPGSRVVVNDNELSVSEAATLADGVRSVKAVSGRVAVEVGRAVQEDWDAFAGAIRMEAGLRKSGQDPDVIYLADSLELTVTLTDGYRSGDLLWVCLPGSLSRLYGGGQMKQFAVDFAGRDAVSVPLAVTGPTMNRDGLPAPHHIAVCLRNMFEEERACNPGPITVLVSARPS